ncbi:MsnO8 family LLM class oxidoreductase [Rothia aerolata]|uniref:Methylene-tetrahydromethanopterin reductase n=1 Tax=Rothia aerolata TaxID=1812262 RepID=A0A917INH6_9MICC|nr:MsnO8 family LLM class oxidoreductase [Rothia aerolata]GGH59589.1 methylene-tetrahydromethanopterin reductase [Rothia aerolata]
MLISVLDRAAAASQESEAETLRQVSAHAQHVESLGFHRFMVAEHHAVAGIPGSQPAILAAHVASSTSTLRVGTAGVMVPDHPPLIIAEQVGLLEALYPGRIDIGLGSSVGFTAPVRQALRQGTPSEAKARLEDDFRELLSYLSGSAGITARPENRAQTPLYVLAGYRSAFLAAKLGLKVILGGPVEVQLKAAQVYRGNFVPSAFAAEPEVVSSLNIAVAESERAASDLLLPESYAKALSRSTGVFSALAPAAELDLESLTSQQKKRIADFQAHCIVGTPAQVRESLMAASEKLGVQEFLVTGDIPDQAGRARSEELLAEIAQGLSR